MGWDSQEKTLVIHFEFLVIAPAAEGRARRDYARAIVTTVEHRVPLMRSKWVHHQWAHQEGEQSKGSRLADGPSSAPWQLGKDGIDTHD